MAALLLLLASFLPSGAQVEPTRVDFIELNRFHDRHTHKPVFDQFIFWDFSPSPNAPEVKRAYHVVEWRLATKVQLKPEPRGNGYLLVWFDEKDSQQRKVFGRFYIETASTFDPETNDRDELPCNQRRGFCASDSVVRPVVLCRVLLHGDDMADSVEMD